MNNSISFALEVYFLAAVVGISIAALMKGLIAGIQRITAKKEAITGHAASEEGKEA